MVKRRGVKNSGGGGVGPWMKLCPNPIPNVKAYSETLTLTRNKTNFLIVIRAYHVVKIVFRQYLARGAF